MIAVRLVLLLALFLSFEALAQTKTIVFVNGIQNTKKAASESAKTIRRLLDDSSTRGSAKKEFIVEYVWNPIGFNGTEDGCDSCQDVKELFIQKTAEEHFAAEFPKLTHSFNSSAILDLKAAKTIRSFYDDLTPGSNSLEANGSITDDILAPTKKALEGILSKLRDRTARKIFVAHSQGNLLINLAWAAFVDENGQDADNWVRFINVANTSRFSIHKLNLTHAKDAALFSKATDTFDKDISLEALPSAGRNWNRTTPDCANAACNFKILSPTFAGVDGTPGLFDHQFVETYLSTTTQLPTPLEFPVAFTAGKEMFFDRFEDLVYAAATSLDLLSQASNFLADDFSGTFLDTTKWTGRGSIPNAGYGLPTVANGIAHFANCQYADTKDKVSFSGSKFVIETRFAGPKATGRDTWVGLFDPSTGSRLLIHDTNYQGWGVSVYLDKNYVMELNKVFGGTTSAFKEYRITVEGTSVTVERGDSLASLSEKHVVTLPRSATDGKYYLGIGTGGCDGFYSPGDFDWIRVTSTGASTTNTSRTFTVPANSYPGVAFTNPLPAAATCEATAAGTWKSAPWATYVVGPDGDPAYPAEIGNFKSGDFNAWALPTAPSMALLVRRSATALEKIGSKGTFQLATGETVTFLSNDVPWSSGGNAYPDNVGSVDVTVTCH